MELRYESAGRPRDEALVFLHGFMGRGTDWRRIAESFSDEHYCLMPDLPGHGAGDVHWEPVDHGLERTARAIEALLVSRSVERATLVGYSMGGRLALLTALERPARIRRLVLESARPGLATEAEREGRRRRDLELLERMIKRGLPDFLREWYAQPIFASLARNPGNLEALIEARRSNRIVGLGHSLRYAGAGSMPSLWDRLGELAIPVLQICGELDAKFVDINEKMAARLPDTRLEILPDCGHIAHFERPEEFRRLLHEFLTSDVSSDQERST